ncbi:GntR family transcriptional regulator [Brevundimonas albigilva]|uniref:GntR family transcriptional regulator n=1 Tax=Brevundimonas albigilva TaxID=1312364 RepID=UPI00201B4AAC|nr:GntR family transcriptional regulator [Brevundimonas albigilva]UQV18933.1 GntR family transcriptional regulator [Brevundimonas albigilva]
MSRARDPYNEALAALLAFAGVGRFGWGEPLVATTLAEELGLSPTPVREALARLSGEGLIEHRPGRGYYAPSPSPDDIVDLYELHRRLVHWALDVLSHRDDHSLPIVLDLSSAEALFVGVVRTSGRAVLARAHWRTTLQIRPIRSVEARLLPEDPDWLRAVGADIATGDLDLVRVAVDAFHRSRSAQAGAVVALMRQSQQSIDQI